MTPDAFRSFSHLLFLMGIATVVALFAQEYVWHLAAWAAALVWILCGFAADLIAVRVERANALEVERMRARRRRD